MFCSVLSEAVEMILANLVNLMDFKQTLKTHVWSRVFHMFLCANAHSNRQCLEIKKTQFKLEMNMNTNFNVFTEYYRWKEIYFVFVYLGWSTDDINNK